MKKSVCSFLVCILALVFVAAKAAIAQPGPSLMAYPVNFYKLKQEGDNEVVQFDRERDYPFDNLPVEKTRLELTQFDVAQQGLTIARDFCRAFITHKKGPEFCPVSSTEKTVSYDPTRDLKGTPIDGIYTLETYRFTQERLKFMNEETDQPTGLLVVHAGRYFRTYLASLEHIRTSEDNEMLYANLGYMDPGPAFDSVEDGDDTAPEGDMKWRDRNGDGKKSEDELFPLDETMTLSRGYTIRSFSQKHLGSRQIDANWIVFNLRRHYGVFVVNRDSTKETRIRLANGKLILNSLMQQGDKKVKTDTFLERWNKTTYDELPPELKALIDKEALYKMIFGKAPDPQPAAEKGDGK